MNSDTPRLIEAAFPLKQASLDSVHEKNVRHGHISTLHIWPARRPLAACRAALIATLLPDPGTPEGRRELCERIGGRVETYLETKKKNGKTVTVERERTVGGVLHWGNESNPDMDWFREEIRKACGGRAPKVLDPFAGGGAIPLEAMRLGCEATAIDINPVAWFILKCTLEYPQKLAGQTLPLPRFAAQSPEFMESFLRGRGKSKRSKKQVEKERTMFQDDLLPPPEADLSWHVRAWGKWVLDKARAELERFYPTIDGKTTVAYLWARTVTCKNCRATIPLLKTRWLCKKDDKRVRLTMEPNADRSGVVFGIKKDVPHAGVNNAARREHDKKIAAGTMSRSGAQCPCCPAIMTMEDIRLEGQNGRLGTQMTAVVVDGAKGKEYRLPTDTEIAIAQSCAGELERVFADVPFGLPTEPTPCKGALGFSVPLYGIDQWHKLFTPRQLVALGSFIKATRETHAEMKANCYSDEWTVAILAYLACIIDRVIDRCCSLCTWTVGYDKIGHVFVRFALPIIWDFVESIPIADTTGGYAGNVEWVAKYASHVSCFGIRVPSAKVAVCSATKVVGSRCFDVIVTDPPYYDAIPYSDLMDFFYVWLRRFVQGLGSEYEFAFKQPHGPKWNHNSNDGELIDDSSRFGGNKLASKKAYEDGMYRAFVSCRETLHDEGKLVIVFANKQPDAWESLVSAIIRAGFIVDASWPIQTEMGNRTRALSSAALSSSVWLVCKKRQASSCPGWDNSVLSQMHNRIADKLRDFWDAGIRGPDFVWAATGPALEAYSKYPVVKKADEPGQTLTVSEFLRAVRRIVVDFVVGRVLSHGSDEQAVTGLDDVTTYYLLHRHDFGLRDAPSGPCILYAVSCGLSDHELADHHEILIRTGGKADDEEDEESDEPGEAEADAEMEEGTGSTVRLRAWNQRKRKSMGYDAKSKPAPLIDQIHRMMHLWRAGDAVKVDEYLDDRALRRNNLFHRLLQALIELASAGSEERSLLESISNHVNARGIAASAADDWVDMQESR
ncbi:MAG: DUF1156 domain-containing protein [Candidatus Sumerlaeota bacterium]|nr:DUF1156 domain-containing protein [Candidatus Sumerlaeota bacterium]